MTATGQHSRVVGRNRYARTGVLDGRPRCRYRQYDDAVLDGLGPPAATSRRTVPSRRSSAPAHATNGHNAINVDSNADDPQFLRLDTHSLK